MVVGTGDRASEGDSKPERKPKKPKQLQEAPMASFTLRDFRAEDWRWKTPEGTRILIKRRIHVGVPEEMRQAVELTKERTGLSMSEIMRRCAKHLTINTIRIKK